MGRKSHLGIPRIRIINIPSNGHNSLAAFRLLFADHRGNGHFIVIINGGQRHGHFMGEGFQVLKKPRIDGLLRQFVNQILNGTLIRCLNRTEKNLCTLLVNPVDFIFFRIQNHR